MLLVGAFLGIPYPIGPNPGHLLPQSAAAAPKHFDLQMYLRHPMRPLDQVPVAGTNPVDICDDRHMANLSSESHSEEPDHPTETPTT